MTRETIPGTLEARGRAFWARISETYELSEAERELLIEACRNMDLLDALAASVAAEGFTVEGSAGQPRAHPALGELRQSRLALGQLLAQLQLEDEDGQSMPTRQQAKARKAAEKRWQTHHAKAAPMRGA